MKNYPLLFSFLFFANLSSYSQNWVQKDFLDIFYQKTDSINAEYKRIIKKPESKKENEVVEIYNLKGQLLSRDEYKSLDKGVKNGLSQSFYSDGQVFYEVEYKDGTKNGEFKSYYENGQLHRKDIYENGKLISGNCFTSSGKDTTYYDFEVMPTFKGGNEALRKFLKNNFVYPKEARKQNIQGKVYVGFIITENGEVENIEVLKSVHPLLDKEAVRIVALSNMMWNPGLQENKKIRVQYRFPINFQLQ